MDAPAIQPPTKRSKISSEVTNSKDHNTSGLESAGSPPTKDVASLPKNRPSSAGQRDRNPPTTKNSTPNTPEMG